MGNVILQQYKARAEIKWRSGHVPRSEPECGFDGAKCKFYPREYGGLTIPHISYSFYYVFVIYLI